MPIADATLRAAAARAPFRVAVAQIAPKLGDLSANFETHRQQIDVARNAKADLIVFPELSLTGYYLRDQVPEVGQPTGGPLLRAVMEAAGNMAVVCGFAEEDRAYRFFNSSAFLDRGACVHVHRKVYLPTYGMFDEQRYFAAGNRVQAFETRFGRAGILICEDAWHLSCGVILGADEIDYLIVVANSPGRGVREEVLGSQETWQHVIRTFAMFLNVPVIFANRVGYEDGVCFWGGSQILGPSGAALAEAPVLEPSLIVADIDPRETRLQRILTPLGRDERIGLTIDELERIHDEGLGRKSRF
jgi:predicted amidohydrolase